MLRSFLSFLFWISLLVSRNYFSFSYGKTFPFCRFSFFAVIGEHSLFFSDRDKCRKISDLIWQRYGPGWGGWKLEEIFFSFWLMIWQIFLVNGIKLRKKNKKVPQVDWEEKNLSSGAFPSQILIPFILLLFHINGFLIFLRCLQFFRIDCCAIT